MQAKQNIDGNPLGFAPIGGLIRKFAIPSMISFLVSAAYNITDQIFIGRVVGMLGNAATNVAFPVVILSIALAQLVGAGTAANFNISMGAQQTEEAKKYIGTGLMLSVIFGLVLGLFVLVCKTPILRICGATDGVMPYAQTYLGITACGLPFLLFSSANNMLVRADGSPGYSMVCTVTGAVLNVGLDALFMLVFHWGMQGAALATMIGQLVSFCMSFGYFFRFQAFKIERTMFRLQIAYVIQISKLGLSNFINQIIMMLVNIVMNNTLTRYGAQSVFGSDIPLAVSGVAAKLNSIMIGFTVGLAQGCQPIFSYNMGAENYSRIKETYKKAALAALCFSTAAFFIFQFFPRQITGIFGTGSDTYYAFAEQYLRIYMMMVFLTGIQPLTVNYFTSIGDVRQGIVLSLSRQGLFLLPLLLVLPLFFGLKGALFAGPIAEVMACALSMFWIRKSFRRLTELERAEK